MPEAQFALDEQVPLQELTQADGIGVGVAVANGVAVGVGVGVGLAVGLLVGVGVGVDVGVGVEQTHVVLDSQAAFLQ